MSRYFNRFIAESQRPLKGYEPQINSPFAYSGAVPQHPVEKADTTHGEHTLPSKPLVHASTSNLEASQGDGAPSHTRKADKPEHSPALKAQTSEAPAQVEKPNIEAKSAQSSALLPSLHPQPVAQQRAKPSMRITRNVHQPAQIEHPHRGQSKPSITSSTQTQPSENIKQVAKESPENTDFSDVPTLLPEASEQLPAEPVAAPPNSVPRRPSIPLRHQPSEQQRRWSQPSQERAKESPPKPNVHIGEVRIRIVDVGEKTQATANKPSATEDSDSRLLIRGI
ncbi:hypothetical protein [Pseudoalteromonas sp. GB56]